MGKAGRRKKNRQRRKKQLNSDPISGGGGGDDDYDNDDDDNVMLSSKNNSIIANPQSAVQRLRHADPQVRHAALVALQASVLSQLHCASQKPVSMKVLQAVREQVTSNDLECSAVAADCMAQYLVAVSANKSKKSATNANANANANANNSDQQKQTTASWALVLLGRLDDCRKALEDQRQQHQRQQQQSSKGQQLSKNQRKKAEKTKKRWYAVSAPCFIALCQLIEDNGYALDQINLQKKTFVEVVFGMLSLECCESTTFDDTAMDDDGADEDAAQQQQHDAIFAKLRDTSALYSARCLHSALDDNWELAEALDCSGEQQQQQQHLWKNLLGKSDGGLLDGYFLSPMTRLHLIGCLVNLYQLNLHGGADNRTSIDSVSWHEKAILEYGISSSSSNSSSSSEEGLLLEVLLSEKTNHQNPAETAPTLLQTRLAENEAMYRNAQALLEKQRRDQQLEEEIDAKVRERKEPAKLIAKRQKKVKEAKREAFREQQKEKMIAEAELEAANDDDDADMMDAASDDEEEGAPTNKKHGTSSTMIREQDGEEAKNEAILEWTSTTGPIQLGLEIFTNLVSTWISPQGGGSEDDDPMGGGGGETNTRFSSELFRTTRDQNMAPILALTLQTLSQFLTKSRATITTTEMPDDPIRSDAEETIEKVAACVTNCFLGGIIIDDHTGTGTGTTTLCEITHSGLLSAELEQAFPSEAVLDAGTSILAVAVEMNPGVLRFRNSADHVALFRRLLPRADAVSLLSSVVLFETTTTKVSSVETEAIIRSLTEDFLALLLSTTSTTTPQQQPVVDHHSNTNTQISILKTFMDWYGNDDFYPHLYETLGVSGAIRVVLDSFARNETNNLDLDEEGLQILHNSGRFLDYKKQLTGQR